MSSYILGGWTVCFYEDEVTKERMNIYLRDSLDQILTVSAFSFFKNNGAKITRFLERLENENPVWVDWNYQSMRQVEVHSSGLLSLSEITFPEVGMLLDFNRFREFQEFLVKARLVSAHSFESWEDTTGGFIRDLNSYGFATSCAEMLTVIREVITTRNLNGIEGYPRVCEILLSIFFEQYWQHVKPKHLYAIPSGTTLEFYESMMELLAPDTQVNPGITLREIRKLFKEVAKNIGAGNLFIIISQPIHCSNKVIDEIHHLATQNLCKFMLINPSEKNVARLYDLGECDPDWPMPIELEGLNSDDVNLLLEVQSRKIDFSQIPSQTPLVLYESDLFIGNSAMQSFDTVKENIRIRQSLNEE
jgi:hypothetical protein